MSTQSIDLQKYLSTQSRAALGRVEDNSTDVVAWKTLIAELSDMPLHYTRPLWKRFFEAFPTAAGPLQAYLKLECAAGNHHIVKEWFDATGGNGAALLCPYTPVWLCYLDAIEATTASTRDVHDAYNFARTHIGAARDSLKFWTRFIAFIQTHVVAHEATGQIRALYHDALLTPLDGVESLWEDYERFEAAARDHTSRATISPELIQSHKRAVYALGELHKTYHADLDTEHIPRSYALCESSTGLGGAERSRDLSQYMAWRKAIAYELSNPLALKDRDPRFISRVTHTYRRALCHLLHHVELWLELANLLTGARGKIDDARQLFEEGIKLLPTNVVLHAAYADALCSDLRQDRVKDLERGRAVFESLIKHIREKVSSVQLGAVATSLYLRWTRYSNPVEGVEVSRVLYKRAVEEDPEARVYLAPAMAQLEESAAQDLPTALALFESLSPAELARAAVPFSELLVRNGSYDRALEALRSSSSSTALEARMISLHKDRNFLMPGNELWWASEPARLNWFLSEEGIWCDRTPQGTALPANAFDVPSPFVDDHGSIRPHACCPIQYPASHLQSGPVVVPRSLVPFRPVPNDFRPTPNTAFIEPDKIVDEATALEVGTSAQAPALSRGGHTSSVPPTSAAEVERRLKRSAARLERFSVFRSYGTHAGAGGSKRQRSDAFDTSSLPQQLRWLLRSLPSPDAVVGCAEPLLRSVPSVPFVMKTLVGLDGAMFSKSLGNARKQDEAVTD